MGTFRLFLRRWFRLPSPVDLGWSKTNALGLREFTPYQEGKTWEDWTEHVSAHYPIRYLLLEVLPLFVTYRVLGPMKRAVALILDYVLPSRRFHLLDLRGIDPLSDYRHGYIDPCEVFRLAGWASLMRWHRESGVARLDPKLIQSGQYREALDLVEYWTVTRLEHDRKCNQLQKAVNEIAISSENKALYDAANAEWLSHYRSSEELEEAMWLRLAALRAFLWD